MHTLQTDRHTPLRVVLNNVGECGRNCLTQGRRRYHKETSEYWCACLASRRRLTDVFLTERQTEQDDRARLACMDQQRCSHVPTIHTHIEVFIRLRGSRQEVPLPRKTQRVRA